MDWSWWARIRNLILISDSLWCVPPKHSSSGHRECDWAKRAFERLLSVVLLLIEIVFKKCFFHHFLIILTPRHAQSGQHKDKIIEILPTVSCRINAAPLFYRYGKINRVAARPWPLGWLDQIFLVSFNCLHKKSIATVIYSEYIFPNWSKDAELHVLR